MTKGKVSAEFECWLGSYVGRPAFYPLGLGELVSGLSGRTEKLCLVEVERMAHPPPPKRITNTVSHRLALILLQFKQESQVRNKASAFQKAWQKRFWKIVGLRQIGLRNLQWDEQSLQSAHNNIITNCNLPTHDHVYN